MTSLEILGGNDAVAKRTQKLAGDCGERARQVAEFELHKYVGNGGATISSFQLELIAEDERIKKIDQFISERESGKHNDSESLGTGLTALINERALPTIAEWMKEHPADDSFFSRVITDVSESDCERLYKMDLSSGAFEALAGGIYFYPEAIVDEHLGILNPGGERHQPDERFHLHVPTIVRIEGCAGELWQNPNLTPDGMPIDAA